MKKTTVELNDDLWHEACALAHREGRTFKSVVEEALHALIVRHSMETGFVLEDAAVNGGELEAAWDDLSLREAIANARERSFA